MEGIKKKLWKGVLWLWEFSRLTSAEKAFQNFFFQNSRGNSFSKGIMRIIDCKKFGSLEGKKNKRGGRVSQGRITRPLYTLGRYLKFILEMLGSHSCMNAGGRKARAAAEPGDRMWIRKEALATDKAGR